MRLLCACVCVQRTFVPLPQPLHPFSHFYIVKSRACNFFSGLVGLTFGICIIAQHPEDEDDDADDAGDVKSYAKTRFSYAHFDFNGCFCIKSHTTRNWFVLYQIQKTTAFADACNRTKSDQTKRAHDWKESNNNNQTIGFHFAAILFIQFYKDFSNKQR